MKKENLAIILAAGIGSRLHPITKIKPKCLVQVNKKSIIDHQIESLMKAGVRDFIIVVGYKAELVKDHLKKYQNISINIIENKDYLKTNNLYSLYLTINEVKMLNMKYDYEKIILLNGDVMFDSEIPKKCLKHSGNIMATQKGVYYEDSMKVTVNENGFINDISKTISKKDAYGVLIDMYFFNNDGWTILEDCIKKYVDMMCEKNLCMESVIKEIINNDAKIFIPYDIKKLFWYEIDDLDDLKNAAIDQKMSTSKKEILEKKLFIFDIDGTIKNGDRIVDYFLPFLKIIKQKGKYYCFLSNNTSLSKTDHLNNLSNILKTELSTLHLFTPLDQIKSYLLNKSINKIYVIGTESVQNFFKENHFKLTDKNPEAVIVTFDTSLSYSKLVAASRILMNPSVEFILANKDLRCPTEFGFIPDAGLIANMLKTTTEHEIDYTGGKPSIEMLQSILETYEVPKEKCVFFGDRLYTDIPMGENAGILTVLVLTGETKLTDLEPENDMLILKSYQELLD